MASKELSPTQAEIVNYFKQGYSLQETANMMDMGKRQLENMLPQIYTKTGKNRIRDFKS